MVKGRQMFKATEGLRQPGAFIPQLESFRGWAILLVVAFHAHGILLGGGPLPADSSIWLRLAGAGSTGVTLFFVLSGFLLTRPFIRALREGARVSIGHFYLARILRIVPLYYAAILVAWLVSGNSTDAFKALMFVPVGFSIFPFSVPWWSLCTEMQFYLLLPWLMLALHQRKGRWLIFLGLSIWLSLHWLHLLEPGWLALPTGSQSSLFGRGFAFLVGGLAAWFHMSAAYARLEASSLRVSLIALALLTALIALLQWCGLMGQRSAIIAMPLYHDLEALLWAGVLLCGLGSMAAGGRLFINPLLSHFGSISYSLYLVHLPVQFYLLHPLKDAGLSPSDIRMITAIIASFMLSWLLAVLCYHAIEKPCLLLKSRLPMLSGRLRVDHARA
jgi:peptidoglycan/LPS O-acetylase OafA/YrhL